MKKIKEHSIAIFKDISENIEVEARLKFETLWLSLNQLVQLFDRDKLVISRHLKNIFDSEELAQDSVVANYATTQT